MTGLCSFVELIQTELHHMRTLHIMETVFRQGMLELQLDPSTVHAMFPCLDQLTRIHSHFLRQLLIRCNNSLQSGSSRNFTINKLGDILLEQVTKVHSYVLYIHSWKWYKDKQCISKNMCVWSSASSQASMLMTWGRPMLSSVATTWSLWNCTRNCWPKTKDFSASYGWERQKHGLIMPNLSIHVLTINLIKKLKKLRDCRPLASS